MVADSIATNTPDIIDLPEDVCKFIKIWNSTAGQYVDAATLAENQSISHDVLEMDAYVHITSPIRRLVDLLNIIKFQQNNGMIELSENSARFYDKWIADLDYINTTMRSIRKVQNDCSLLQYVYAGVDNDTIIDKI